MVVDVAVSMQRQVPALPGGVQTSSSTKSWIASEGISRRFYAIFRTPSFWTSSPGSQGDDFLGALEHSHL